MASIRSRGERLREAVALALVGGFLDAYTYIAHGGVFANAQTGNVILFGVQATAGDWSQAWHHLPPLAAFAAGVVTVEVLARRRNRRWSRRPTRVVLLVEMAVFLVVGLLPAATPNVVTTVVTAWAATMQVATFRNLGEVSYNTTFTTGNLRSLFSEASAWRLDHDAAAGRRAQALGLIIGGFAAGAVAGGFATAWLHTHAVLLTLLPLAAVYTSIVAGTRRLERERATAAGPPASR